jgi:hypothetical protein
MVAHPAFQKVAAGRKLTRLRALPVSPREDQTQSIERPLAGTISERFGIP